MRWTTGMLCIGLLASAGWAQDAKSWRAYGMEKNQFREQLTGSESGAFEILGTGRPTGTDVLDSLWITEPGTSDDVADLASDLIESIYEEAKVVEGGNRILVLATAAQHDVIARTLVLLRAQQGATFEVRHLTIPRELVGADSLAVAAAGGGEMSAELRARLLRLDRYRGSRIGTIQAVAGEWVRYEATRRVNYLAEYDVEIAQGASVPDPIVKTARDGVRVALRAFPLTDGRVVVRLVASGGLLDDELRRFSMRADALPDSLRIRDTNYGEVEQAQYRGMCVATETVLRQGATAIIVLGSTDPETEEINLLMLSLKKAGRPSGESTIALLPTGALTSSPRDWRLRVQQGGEPGWKGDNDPRRNERLDMGALKKVTDNENEGTTTNEFLGGAILVQAPAAKIAGMRGRLARIEQLLLRPARLRMQFQIVEEGRTRPQGSVSLPLMLGSTAVFGAYRRFDYIADYDVEVAQESRIADPVHRIALAGILGDAHVTAIGSDEYRVRLSLNISSAGEPVEVRSNAGGVGPFQRVRRSVIKLLPTIRLKDGKSKTIILGPNPYGEGTLVVQIRCDARVR